MVKWILLAIALLAAGGAAVVYKRTSRMIARLDEMVEAAIDGSFSEKYYTEDRMSRLESRLYRYLSLNRMDRERTAEDRDRIQTLVSDISHQTKTPVANILLYAQLLQEQLGENERDGQGAEQSPSGVKQAAHLAGQIEQQAEKLQFLIQALVKTSRLENGIVEVSARRNSVRTLLHRVGGREAAMEKEIELKIAEPEELDAWFDMKWTAEALDNLVDNAVKYTPPGGKVTVSAQAYEMFVRIDVADTGIGIPEEECGRIFTRFYRSPAVREEKGVGIGLYLAREILSLENGYIKVTSEPGKGSVFSVFLSRQEPLENDREENVTEL